MRFHAFALLVAPLSCLAQVPGLPRRPPRPRFPQAPKLPPEVDKALHDRAKAFLDYESKGDFRKAYDLVAEDSKDYYFGAIKEKSASFTIDEVQYGGDLSTATVKSTMRRETMLAGHMVEVPQVLIYQWKVDKGEWVWYHDPSKDTTKTIIGDLPVAPVERNTGESPILKDLNDKMAREVATTIIAAPKATIDKKFVMFVLGKDGTEQVTFHNGNNGQLRVQAEVRGVADTMTVEPNDVMVNPQADVAFKITYKQHPESAMRGAVLFTLEPFGTVYVLPLRLVREGQIRKPAVTAPIAPASAPAPAPAVPDPAAAK